MCVCWPKANHLLITVSLPNRERNVQPDAVPHHTTSAVHECPPVLQHTNTTAEKLFFSQYISNKLSKKIIPLKAFCGC